MNFKFNLFRMFILLVMFSGCNTTKKLAYLQDMSGIGESEIETKYDLHIKKDDMLSIIVNCKEPELAAPFNMQLVSNAFTGSNQVTSSYGTGTPQGFLVDSNGEITYPIFGNIKVQGMLRIELAEYIRQKLEEGGYIKNPVVNVKLINFKVSVLGEVNRPGTLKVESERITILEAIAQAGDLTVYGKRNKVHLIREQNGMRKSTEIDLRDPNITLSPYYYLQQNDLIYVEPNSAKASQSNYSALWGTIVSVLSLATTIGLYFAK